MEAEHTVERFRYWLRSSTVFLQFKVSRVD